MEHAERAKGRRQLGLDKASGYAVIAQMTRFGPVIQIGDREEISEGEKPRFANLRQGQSLETITLEEALELFKLPRSIGDYKGEDVQVNTGRYGPYVKVGETYVNLPKSVDPMKVDLGDVLPLIEAKMDENAPIGKYNDLPIFKGKGRFGPFVKWNDLFVNIPVRYTLESITEIQAVELIEAKLEKESNRYIRQWPSEKISIENGRWGPFIRFGKANVKIPKIDGQKADEAMIKEVALDTVKAWIEAEIPDAFSKKTAAKKK
jgi:DNA topoisomerase-1